MSKPQAVLRQAKAADQLVRDLNARPADAARLAAAANAASAAAEHAPTNLPNVGDAPPPGAQPVQPAAPAAAAPAEPQFPSVEITPPGAPAAAPAPAPVDWEHRYKVLQGKYNAEVPNMVGTLAETRQMLDQAMRVNQQLQSQLTQRPATPPATPRAEDTFKHVTKEERESFGEDLIDVVGRRAREVVSPELEGLKQQLARMEGALGATLQETAAVKQARVYEALNSRIPSWEEINKSVEFLAWLESADVFSGSSRRIALTNAFNAHDAQRVVGIFEAYVREDASRSTAAPQPLVDPATLIAPGTPRSGSGEAAPGSSRGRIWSESEISDFYDRVRRKRVPKDEYDQVSAEIAQAVKDGRVRPTRADSHLNQR